MAVLPGVPGCRTLRRTVQIRLESNPLRLPGGTAIFTVSPNRFVNIRASHLSFAIYSPRRRFLLPVFRPLFSDFLLSTFFSSAPQKSSLSPAPQSPPDRLE
jgi:hypothetical protein